MFAIDDTFILPKKQTERDRIKKHLDDLDKELEFYKNPPFIEEKKQCEECDYYGQCDHQGAYKRDGKWCYE